MSKLKNFLGIDISKHWFDIALIKADDPSLILHHQFDQGEEGYNKMVAWLLKYGVDLGSETLFCMENTGLYNTALVNFLVRNDTKIWVEMPLKIKKAGGFERGSDDKTASIKIALYAMRYQDNLKLWQPADSNMEKIKNFIAQRDRIISTITKLVVPVKELNECGCGAQVKELEKVQKPVIKALQKAKLAVESLITKTVQLDEKIAKKIKIIQSIKGIGQLQL